MGNPLTKAVGNVLTKLMGNVLTEIVGKVLDIYKDIKDGASLSLANVQQRHYHHLFPIAWLREKDPDADPNSALNCILINRRTNSEILAKEPIKYLLETCEANDLGESEIRRRLQTHFVDFDLLAQGDYGKFSDGRAKTCESAIKSLCGGNAWRP